MSAAAADPLLQAGGVVVSFGLRTVLHGCDISVGPGEVVALFGHNGAGKTTLLRTLAGLKPCDAGTVMIGDDDVTKVSASSRARRGLAFVPDGAGGVFGSLTVAENIAIVCSGRRPGETETLAMLAEMFPVVMRDKRSQVVSRLSGGQRQMVALALAIARSPRVLLLDEPSLGLAPVVVQEMLGAIRDTARRLNTGVILVEQDMPAALAVANHVHIIKQGSIVLSSPAADFPSADSLWKYF
jgi:branched-chain amino acid transport system ATP-binding protein